MLFIYYMYDYISTSTRDARDGDPAAIIDDGHPRPTVRPPMYMRWKWRVHPVPTYIPHADGDEMPSWMQMGTKCRSGRQSSHPESLMAHARGAREFMPSNRTPVARVECRRVGCSGAQCPIALYPPLPPFYKTPAPKRLNM